jgi:hypothetical protein
MNIDEEFSAWREAWQKEPAVPIELIRKVERQTAYMRTLRTAEIVVTVVVGAGVVAGAVVHPVIDQIYWLTLAVGTWLFIAAAWILSIRRTRHTWEAAEPTTAAYVSLQTRRLRRQLERPVLNAAFGILFSAFVLTVVFEAVSHALRVRGVHMGSEDMASFWVVGVVVNVAVVLALIGRRRRLQAELDHIQGIERKLQSDN